MPNVQFIFAIHNHQPVGNFDFVAEEAYRKAYLPFLETLERHPRIKVVLHYTGVLYRFFEERHPEFLDLLRSVIAAGRAEVLTGGFYEPILAVLPDEDKVGQIRALTAYLHRTLGTKATGMWLAERVWEPHLPKFLAAAGVGHIVVDDFHFKMAGLHDDELDGCYLTEEQDGVLRVFPGNERLRYLIPFHPPEETVEFLSRLRTGGRNRLIVMADDGEKFGIWPETYRTVYEEGWLERFLTLLEQNADWLETTTFAAYAAAEPPRGRIYLPTASYMEMGEWSLPTRAMLEYEQALETARSAPGFEKVRPFLKGGIWRNFLAKYPESDHMHKRMLMVSRKVREASAAPAGRGGKRSTTAAQMQDHLYQAQCNDAYWHGIFGGLYLPHLRSAIYEHLLRAESLADAAATSPAGSRRSAPAWLRTERGDFDRDGHEEVMLNSELLNLFVDPTDGGRIAELDWKPRFFNVGNTLTRRREGYHEKLLRLAQEHAGQGGEGGAKTIHELVAAKEEGLQHRLQYDWYRRGSLLDHFLGPGADLAGFLRAEYAEAGDFVLGAYTARSSSAKGRAALLLERDGRVDGRSVRLRKEIVLRSGDPGFAVRYEIRNLNSEELNASFGSEFNFSLLAGNAPDRYYDIPGHRLDKRHLASAGETNNVESVRLVDEWLPLTVALSFSQAAVLWRGPIETVSQSEAGFERVYQSSLVMPIWRISIGPGGRWETEINVSFR